MGYKKQVFRSLAMVSQLGISVMTPIFLCISAGYYVDTHFETETMLFFLMIGVLAGGRLGYRTARMTFLVGERLRQQETAPRYGAVSRPKQPSRVRRSAGSEGEKE